MQVSWEEIARYDPDTRLYASGDLTFHDAGQDVSSLLTSAERRIITERRASWSLDVRSEGRQDLACKGVQC